jgi:hypothetical protein
MAGEKQINFCSEGFEAESLSALIEKASSRGDTLVQAIIAAGRVKIAQPEDSPLAPELDLDKELEELLARDIYDPRQDATRGPWDTKGTSAQRASARALNFFNRPV